MRKTFLAITATFIIGVQPSNANWSDPTRPPDFALQSQNASLENEDGLATLQTPEWSLESVLIDNRRKLAVVNNKLVHEGDTVNGARVVDITPGSVRLQNAARVIELSLTTAVIKRLVGR